MSDQETFQARVLRYIHDSRRGEGLNVGVLLVSSKSRFARAVFLDSMARVTHAFPNANVRAIRRIFRAISQSADHMSGTFAPVALTIDQVTNVGIQELDQAFDVSKEMNGLTRDPAHTLQLLFDTYVRCESKEAERERRDEDDVWRAFTKLPGSHALMIHESEKVFASQHLQLPFEHAWKSDEDRWLVAQPVSLDLVEPRTIREKATNWIGKLRAARPSANRSRVAFLVAFPPRDAGSEVVAAASDAQALLSEELSGEAEVFLEEQSEELMKLISNQIGQAAE